MKIKFKSIYTFMISLIISAFLTNLINFYTLTTKTQVFFVFVYFLFMLLVIEFYYFRFSNNRGGTRMSVYLVSIMFALVASFFIMKDIYPKNFINDSIVINATGQMNDLSKGSEIWISHIRVDDTDVDLKNIPLTGKWIYMKDENALYINPDVSYIKNNMLTLNLPDGKSVEIAFVKHSWSGKLEIIRGNCRSIHDLYSSISDEYRYIFQRQIKEESGIYKYAVFGGCYITMFAVFVFCFGLLNRKVN